MESKNLLSRIKLACQAAFNYFLGHAYVMTLLNGIYRREWQEYGVDVEKWVCTIIINPSGSCYQVTQTLSLNGRQISEDTWLTTYAWSVNGYLHEVGGSKCCFFDYKRKLLYLEKVDKQGFFRPLEVFIKL